MTQIIYQGEYVKIAYTIMDQSVEPAVPADLTGVDLTGWLGWKHEPQLVELSDGVGITILDVPTGQVLVELTSAQMALAPRVYTLELWGSDGTRYELLDRLALEVRDSWRVA